MGSRDNLKSPPSTTFIASGLDSKQSTSSGVNFYGENEDETSRTTTTPTAVAKHNGTGSSSIQYHMLDTGSVSMNKSAVMQQRLERVDSPLDDQTNSTNTSESDETTTNTPRFDSRLHHHNQSMTPSQRDSGVGVSEATLEKQFIQARLIKQPSPKQSTPNTGRPKHFVPFTSSYDKLMNTTLTTDTDDDQDANSKRLLTSKVVTSRPQPQPPSTFAASSFKPSYEPTPQLQSGSMLSNATTNMTSVTPLGNVSLLNAPGVTGIQYSSSDYENLSNSALNEILDNYPKSRAPIVADRRKPPNSQPPPPAPPPQSRPLPPSRPPPIYNQQQQQHHDDDEESLVSCQLITSASLLMNRDLVKEARHITAQPKNVPIAPNPRSLSTKSAQDAVVQVQTDVDATKPPPMETAI